MEFPVLSDTFILKILYVSLCLPVSVHDSHPRVATEDHNCSRQSQCWLPCFLYRGFINLTCYVIWRLTLIDDSTDSSLTLRRRSTKCRWFTHRNSVSRVVVKLVCTGTVQCHRKSRHVMSFYRCDLLLTFDYCSKSASDSRSCRRCVWWRFNCCTYTVSQKLTPANYRSSV